MTRRQALDIFNFDVNTKITPELINKTYKKIAKQIHPDKHNNDAKMVKMFSQLNMANKILLGEEIPDLETKDIPLVSPKEIEAKIAKMWREYNLFKYKKFKNMKLNKIQKNMLDNLDSKEFSFFCLRSFGNKINNSFLVNVLAPIFKWIYEKNLLENDEIDQYLIDEEDDFYYELLKNNQKSFQYKWLNNDIKGGFCLNSIKVDYISISSYKNRQKWGKVTGTDYVFILIFIVIYKFSNFFDFIDINNDNNILSFNIDEIYKIIKNAGLALIFKKIITDFFKLLEENEYIKKIDNEDNTFDQAIKIYKIWQEIKRLEKFKRELLSDLKTI